MASRLRHENKRNHTEVRRYVKIINQKRELTPHGTTKKNTPTSLAVVIMRQNQLLTAF